MREEMSKMKKIHENYTGTIARMDDEGNLEFDFCDDFGAHAILGEYDPAEARALADAIYKDLGLGWLPYPENIPPLAGYYFITMVNINDEPSTFYAKYSFYKNAWLSPFGGLMDDEFYKTVAFMEIPTPYQPEDSHDIV